MSSFNDWRKPYMARGDFMLGGMAVVVSRDVPKQHVADEITPLHWPAPIRWARRLLRRPDCPRRFVRGEKVERDQVIMAAGKVFISPATWEALKEDVAMTTDEAQRARPREARQSIPSTDANTRTDFSSPAVAAPFDSQQ